MPGWWFDLFAGVALKSTVVWLVAWAAALGLRRRSAAARHLVWTGAAAAVLALPLFTLWMPPLSLPAPAGMVDIFIFRLAAAAHSHTTGAGWRPNWLLLLSLIWAAGAAVALVRMAAGFAGIRRMRSTASPSPDLLLGRELAPRVGVSREVPVLETAPGRMPMTCGIWRPVVFMPADATEWSEERRRIVLLHEFAHVRRGDAATQIVARLALILHWWNPLAWVAWKEFLKERERATDDLVLQAGARASDYASHLLDVARSMRGAAPLAWAHVAMARRSQLEGRLAAILDAGVSRNGGGWTAAAVAAVAAMFVAAPWAAVALKPRVVTPKSAVYRVGGAVKPPKLLSKSEPEYTEEARAGGFQGRVLLYIEVGQDGLAHNVRVIQPLGHGLDEKAVAAIRRWRFRPGTKDGVAVPVAANVEVNFRLL